MKKITGILLAVLILVCPALNAAALIENDEIENGFYSDCILLKCIDNGEIIFDKNSTKQTKPASLTKVITASIILEECSDFSEQMIVPEECIRELDGTGSSLSGLKGGEILSVYDLLCCLLVQSANDAATTLAYWSTGADRQAFVDKMNSLAEELGCKDSHFVNVHGLDDEDQYVSCADMAVFFENVLKYPVFTEIASKISYELPETNMQGARTIRSTNFTLMPGYKDYYCKYEVAGKTGTTSGAGSCLVSKASNDGYNYIAVAMNAPKEDLDGDNVDENGAFVDTQTMYDWAFKNLRLVPIANTETIVGEVPVRYGKGTDHVSLSPAENSYSLMPRGIEMDSLLIQVDVESAPAHVTAPVSKGDKICKGKVLYKAETVREIDLVASSDVRRSFASVFGTTVAEVFESPAFKLVAVVIGFALAAIVALRVRSYLNRRKKEGKN